MPSAPPARPSLGGLYVILDSEAARGRSLLDILKQAADGGARMFQYRDKTSSMLAAYRQALALQLAAKNAGAMFLVNDRCDLALAVDADGVVSAAFEGAAADTELIAAFQEVAGSRP